MDIKVLASIISSFAIAFLVYFFNESIFVGLDPWLFATYVVVILVISTIDVFLIIRQKGRSQKLIMILFLILSLLTSMVMGRIDVEKRMKEGSHPVSMFY